jgi:hypothetical protein
VNPSGKPDAGNRPVRFDEGGGDSADCAVPTLHNLWTWFNPKLLTQNINYTKDSKLTDYTVIMAPIEMPSFNLTDCKIFFALSYDMVRQAKA